MNGEAVDLVLRRAKKELAEVRRLRAELEDTLDKLEAMERRNAPPSRPHLYLVE